MLLGALRRLGFRTVIAGTTLPNEASKRLHESTGFVDAGRVRDAGWKFNRWHDVGFWQLRLGDGSAPRRPYAAADLAESDRLALLGERWESPVRR